MQNHLLYLKRILAEGFINQLVYEAAILVLEKMPDMPIPTACTGPDGLLLYHWDNSIHYFEAEFFPDGKIEFFSMDSITKKDDLIVYQPGETFPEFDLNLLKERFCVNNIE